MTIISQDVSSSSKRGYNVLAFRVTDDHGAMEALPEDLSHRVAEEFEKQLQAAAAKTSRLASHGCKYGYSEWECWSGPDGLGTGIHIIFYLDQTREEADAIRAAESFLSSQWQTFLTSNVHLRP